MTRLSRSVSGTVREHSRRTCCLPQGASITQFNSGRRVEPLAAAPLLPARTVGRGTVRRVTVGGVAELRDPPRAAVSPARDGIGSVATAAGHGPTWGAEAFQHACLGCVRPHSQPSRSTIRRTGRLLTPSMGSLDDLFKTAR
jgi:hypothetical protein